MNRKSVAHTPPAEILLMRLRHLFLAFVLFGCLLSQSHAAEKPQLWLYYPTNFLVDKNLDKARKSGRARRRRGMTMC